jgi:3-methyladenine DNA glycosylase Mpg
MIHSSMTTICIRWTEKTTSLIEALMIEMSEEARWWSMFISKPTIVVLGKEPRFSMIQTTRLAISKKVTRHSNVRLIFREGDVKS